MVSPQYSIVVTNQEYSDGVGPSPKGRMLTLAKHEKEWKRWQNKKKNVEKRRKRDKNTKRRKRFFSSMLFR